MLRGIGFPLHQGANSVRVQRRSADEPMAAKLPDVTFAAAWRAITNIRNDVIIWITRLCGCEALDQAIDFRKREADGFNVEVEVKLEQGTQFLRQKVFVPAGIQCQLVVGYHIGPLQLQRHMFDPDTRHRGHVQHSRRLNPAMAGKDRVGNINQNGIRESERSDALSNLPDLFPGMCSCIPRPRAKRAALYRLYPSKSAIMDAIVREAMDDEVDLAGKWLDGDGPAAERMLNMILDIHHRKRSRFSGDREIHDLYRRIMVERQDIIVAYAERMTLLIATLITQGVERGEWRVSDVSVAAGVVRDGVTPFIHPQFVALAVEAGSPVEDQLRAMVTTLTRAFQAGVDYAPVPTGT